jgi:hypothetical protein
MVHTAEAVTQRCRPHQTQKISCRHRIWLDLVHKLGRACTERKPAFRQYRNTETLDFLRLRGARDQRQESCCAFNFNSLASSEQSSSCLAVLRFGLR